MNKERNMNNHFPTLKTVCMTLLLNLIVLPAQATDDLLTQKIDHYIKHVMHRQGIPGANLAIIQNDQIIYQKSHGLANLEHQVPMSKDTIFRVYSVTKLMVVTGVFQLIEQNKLNLHDPITQLLPDLPKAWQQIQLKHLITHSSGLPDMAPFIDFQDLTEEQAVAVVTTQPLSTSAGERYDYNQTNFWLLRRIIEQVSRRSLDDFIINNQFPNAGSTVFFSGDSRQVVVGRATPYFPFRTGQMIIDHSYQQGKYLDAANALNLNLQQFMDWDRRLRHHQLLQADTQQQMWQLFAYSGSEKQFTHGWDRHVLKGQASYGFTGSLVTAYRVFPEQQLSLIMLSNGLEKYYNIDQIINHLAGLIDQQLAEPNNQVFEALLQAKLTATTAFETVFKQLKATPHHADVNFESQINAVGYFLLNLAKNNQAIEVLAFNTRQYPESWNVYDSLAEAYERNQQFEQALPLYRKALVLSQQTSGQHVTRLNNKIAELQSERNNPP